MEQLVLEQLRRRFELGGGAASQRPRSPRRPSPLPLAPTPQSPSSSSLQPPSRCPRAPHFSWPLVPRHPTPIHPHPRPGRASEIRAQYNCSDLKTTPHPLPPAPPPHKKLSLLPTHRLPMGASNSSSGPSPTSGWEDVSRPTRSLESQLCLRRFPGLSTLLPPVLLPPAPPHTRLRQSSL